MPLNIEHTCENCTMWTKSEVDHCLCDKCYEIALQEAYEKGLAEGKDIK